MGFDGEDIIEEEDALALPGSEIAVGVGVVSLRWCGGCSVRGCCGFLGE